MKRVLIVDDHVVVRHGLKMAIQAHGYEVVSEAESVSQARAFMAHTNPEILLVDINLPDGSGFDLITWARVLSKTLVIVVLTLNDHIDYVNAARKAGANAFLVKDSTMIEIIAAIDFSIASPRTFASKLTIKPVSESGLTTREIDVLHGVDHGSSNALIASNLFISVSTVKTHVSSILRKLNADNRIQALAKARELGLLSK